MRQTFWIIGLITALATTQITTLATTAAYAQAFGEGVVNAVSFRPLPAGMSIQVQALDNSDDNLILIDEVKKALTARGYHLSDDGGMVMTLETRSEIGAWSTIDRRHTLEIKGETGSHSDDAQVKLNLFDSNSGGILNQGSSGTTIVTPSQYVVEVSLDNITDGKRHWQAWAAAELGQSDGLTLMRGMIPALSDAVGKTVSQQTFHLQ